MEDAVGTRAATLAFGVLGPLVVAREGQAVAVGGPQERTVLAHLLARANLVVPVAALIESVWGDDPPPSAERALQAHVARLRRAFEPDRPASVGSSILVRSGAGYHLRVDSAQVDALHFEELARQGARGLAEGDAGAPDALRRALDLWRGDAFGEFLDVEPCEVEARRLEEMHLVVTEDRIDADLAAGAASELVGELEALVARHEFRERLWAQLMLALYRSGRQRDALAAYRRARETLVEQLGIEPGRELRALEAAVLEQDPALDLRIARSPAFGLPAPLEAVGPAFVGRKAELGRLRTAWLAAADGRGGFVSVLGPEGIGKTRLVAELAREVQRAGGAVVYANCGDRRSGFQAILDEVAQGAAASVDELAGPSPGEHGADVMQLLVSQFGGRPVLFVVDDVHLADDVTIEVLADLAGWSGAGPLLVVATFRTEDDATDPPQPHPEVGAQLVLSGLDRDSLRRVCDMYAVEPWLPDDIDRLHQLSGGVPLRVHELASEWARERAIRDVAAAADRSAAAQSRLVGLRAEIAQSVEGIQHVLEQRRANVASRHTAGVQAADAGGRACPYKGLAAFEPTDAALFFGRERLVAELVARLAGAQLLAVVGPSGSGKSSVVRAGLVPALADGVLPVAGGWQITVETPSTMRREQDRGGSEPAGGRRLHVVDQFEELFTGALGRDAQRECVDGVVSAARHPDHCVVVVIRADHLDHCIEFDELAGLIAGNDVLVGPMTDVELRRAIERPAQRAGRTFDPGLVGVIVADVAGRPGALPLLSTALAETWARSDGDTLTMAAYRAAGGVDEALATLAEDAFAQLDPAAQRAIRRFVLRLCDVDDVGSSDVRRRVPFDELEVDEAGRMALAAFVDRRLLVVDRDTVEVAHEALLREWPRLRTWMDEDRQGRRLHRRIGDSARSWQASADPSELYRGTRLESALDWAAGHGDDLTASDRAFLDASAEEAARELDEAQRQAAQKARDNRRLRWSLIGLAGLLVVAVIAGVSFVRQRDRAEQSARDARARALASEATGAIDEDPELAMLLALAAVATHERNGQDPLRESVSALHAATQSSRLIFHRPEAIGSVDVSSDGSRIVTASAEDEGAALLWDADTGTQLATLAGPGEDLGLNDVLFDPTGRTIATVYRNGIDGAAPAVVLWDAVSGRETARLMGLDDDYFVPAFSADGRLLVTTSFGGDDTDDRITVWDLTTGSESLTFQLEGLSGGAIFVADDTALAVTEDTPERVGIYSTTDGALQRSIPTPGFLPGSPQLDVPSGLLALGSQADREVRIVDFESGRLVRRIPMTDVGPLDWSPDGARLAVAGANQGPIRIYDVPSGAEPLVLSGHESGSWDAQFIGDGDRLASVGQFGELRVWDVSPRGPAALGAIAPASGSPWHVEMSPDGSEIIVSTTGQTIERLATATGEQLATRGGQLVGFLPFHAPVSPDGRFVASTNQADGTGAVLDARNLEPIVPLPPCASPIDFSPDGSLLALDSHRLCVPGSGIAFDAPPGADLRSRIIEVDSGRDVLDLGDDWIAEADFNPPGQFEADRYVVVSVDFTRLDFYDLVESRLIGSLEVPDAVFKQVFDPTGRWLVGVTGDGHFWVLDFAAVVNGRAAADAIVLDVAAHDGSITFDLSTDGTLATIGGEQVRLWDLDTGELLLELRTNPPAGLSSLAFTPGGDLLYSDGDVLRRYRRDTDELVRLARSLLTRELTADECRTYLDGDCT